MDIKYSKVQALRLIRRIITEGGQLVLSGHYKKRMLERGVEYSDVLRVIKKGVMLNEPEPHIRTGKLIYTIEGTTVDGARLKVPVAIYEEDNEVVVVTVMN